MKVNRRVFDLARKLDYIKIAPEKRREMIMLYSRPLYKLIGASTLIRKMIDRTYEEIKYKKLEMERINELNEQYRFMEVIY